LEVERQFSDPIRLESGCESSEKGENRRGKTLLHDPQERHPGIGSFFDEERASAVAHGGIDRAIATGRGQLIDVLGRASIEAVLRLSAAGIAGPPHPGKKGGAVGGMAEVGERTYQILPLRFAGDLHSPALGTFGEVSLEY
jgi:hypothetical protein